MISKTKLDLVEDDLLKLKAKLPDYLREHGIDVVEGKKFKCFNPEHSDKSPSMSVFKADNGSIICKCFSCGFVADIFAAAHILEEKPIAGPAFLHDNVKYLADKYSIDIQFQAMSEEELYEFQTYEAYKAAANFINNQAYTPKCTEEVDKRKWDEGFLKEYLVSCCVDYHAMRQYLKNLGYAAKFLDEIDLDNQRIFNADSLIFTITDEWGRPVGFSARNLNYDGVKDAQKNLVNGTKFNNTKTTGMKCNIYRKSERLYLMHVAKKNVSPGSPLYIVEGYGDALTLHMNGMKNAVAMSGVEINDKQMNLCRKLGINDIVICLDGDKAGEDKAKQVLDEVLKNVHDLRIRFVFIPYNKDEKVDPDLFVREHGIDAFQALPKIEPFAWRLQEFVKEIEGKSGVVTDSDNEHICHSIIPIIANDPSPLKRESMIKELSLVTGYSFQVIREELDKILNAEAAKLQRRKASIADELTSALKGRSDGYEIVIERALQDLEFINKESNSDKFDSDSLVSIISSIKDYQESEDLHKTINFGPNLETLPIALAGDIRQKLILLGGGANTGKTALFSNMSLNLAEFNEDIISVVFTIDDGTRDFLSRLVSYDVAKRLYYRGDEDLFDVLNIGKIMTPFRYKNNPEYNSLMQERQESYAKIKGMVSDGKLAIFDSSYGKNISVVRTIIKRFKAKYPGKSIWFFIDNFHLLDGTTALEGREKYKDLSHDIKDIAITNDITVCSTVEYTKLPAGTRPGNSNIAETVALDYDSNATMHLYNELHDLREKSKHYFENGEGLKMPVIEHYFGKNKISSFKDTIHYKFYCDKSFYLEITPEQKEEIAKMNEVAADVFSNREGNTPYEKEAVNFNPRRN